MSVRVPLPKERESKTTSFTVNGVKMFITAGMYPDGRLGEVFVKGAGPEGSTMHALVSGFATLLSISLQYGAPLDTLARKFHDTNFEPNGPTDHEVLGEVQSLYDGLFKWLVHEFGSDELKKELGVA